MITACGEQDCTYREYIAENWPGIQFVKTLQMESYAYPWFIMPEGESKDCLRSDFMKQYDFLSEGDSPTFFVFLDWGFRTLENFTYGGISDRYEKEQGQVRYAK